MMPKITETMDKLYLELSQFTGALNSREIEMIEALEAIDAEARDHGPNGDVVIPSHVWDLTRQALSSVRNREN